MTFILLTAAIIGLVWSLIYIRHFNPITTAVLALTIGGCFGHAFFSVSVITIDRLLIGGMFAQYLLFRYFQRAEHKPIGGMDYVFFGLILYLFVNVFSSNWRADESAPVSFWLFFYLLPSVIYWVTRNSPVDEREFNIMCYGLGAFGLYLAVTGFAETRQWWWMVYPKHIGDPSVTEFLGRGRGPFQNPISNGIYIGIGWCSALMFWPKVGKRGKAIILALSLVFAVGVYSTYTRSVWMGGATAVGICFWLPSSWSRRGLAIASLIVLGFVGLFAKDALTQFKRDRFVTETQMAESAKLRPMLAAVAVNVFEDKPIFGTGLRQYRRYNHQYVTDGRWNMPLRRVQNYIQHNWILSLLVETGLIGVLLLLAVGARRSFTMEICCCRANLLRKTSSRVKNICASQPRQVIQERNSIWHKS